MTDWPATGAGIATAAGTLVLAVATFSAVRSSQRAARATEVALLSAIRPVLVPSNLEDPPQEISFMDDHWVTVTGGRAVAESTDEAIYLAMSLRNLGNGLAVLDRWNLSLNLTTDEINTRPDNVRDFRRLTRDIYVPAGQLGFWQGAMRDSGDPLFDAARQAVSDREMLIIDLLYGDQEGGQRTITRFAYRSHEDGRWTPTVARHWRLDRPDPR